MQPQLNNSRKMNTSIEIDGPRSDETYYLNIAYWEKETMFQTNDFKQEEIEKSLKWNFEKIAMENWLNEFALFDKGLLWMSNFFNGFHFNIYTQRSDTSVIVSTIWALIWRKRLYGHAMDRNLHKIIC